MIDEKPAQWIGSHCFIHQISPVFESGDSKKCQHGNRYVTPTAFIYAVKNQ